MPKNHGSRRATKEDVKEAIKIRRRRRREVNQEHVAEEAKNSVIHVLALPKSCVCPYSLHISYSVCNPLLKVSPLFFTQASFCLWISASLACASNKAFVFSLGPWFSRLSCWCERRISRLHETINETWTCKLHELKIALKIQRVNRPSNSLKANTPMLWSAANPSYLFAWYIQSHCIMFASPIDEWAAINACSETDFGMQ